jgi:integrase
VATVQPRTDSQGKTRYRVQIRLKGYPPETATFDRKTDANRWAQQTETDMKAGRYFKTAESRRHTVAQLIERYLLDIVPNKRPSTQRSQIPQLEWWRKRLGHLALADLSPVLIAEARDELARASTHLGEGRSSSTVARYLAVLSHCLTIAVKELGWIEDTPMRKVSRPKETRGIIRFLSPEERNRLLENCKQSKNPYLFQIVVLALSTGMRRSEIMHLTWDRVDLGRREIVLRPEDTKNNEVRVLPLVGHAHKALLELHSSRDKGMPYVFPAPAMDGRPPRPYDIESAWRLALKRADVKDFRFHDLRHSTASYLAMDGATSVEIAAVLGHKTLQMVKRYAHLSPAHTSAVVERMNTAIFGNA